MKYLKKKSKYLPFNKYDNEEISLGSIIFEKKVFCSYEIGYCVNTSDEKVLIEIFGTKGSLKWPDNKYEILHKNKLVKKSLSVKKFLASDKQLNFFLNKRKSKKQLNTNIKEYKYIVDLIDRLYKFSSNK